VTTLEAKGVLARLKNVKRVGSGWVASCPVPTHGRRRGDLHPSLSVSEGADGSVLLHCHAGCSPEQIVAAIGLTMSDLFPKHERTLTTERTIVATYPYHDAEGKPLFEVVRFEPKGFAVRRPDGKGGWIRNLDGVPRVLYRLPEVLEAIKRGETVFIVEGEKDVESLRDLGLTATTNPHGAGKWRDEYSDSLRGAHAVIIPDKDEPGRKHAETAARSLHGVAASVKVLELPGDSKDVSEWLAAGYTREDLEALVEQTPEWEPPEPVHPPSEMGDTLTDLGNAERFAKLHKDAARHVPAWGWLVWDGRRWAPDETNAVTRLAIETVRAIYREAAECADANKRKQIADHAKRSESRQRIEAMLKLAEALLADPPSAFDRDPYLLNVLNGTIDLKAMQLREHRREDNITKLAPVEFDPAARCPLWEAFLERIFDGNHALISFLQRAVGYALTGDTREQCLFILWGTGANGKSTFVTTIQAILGDYALQTPTETLLAKRTEYIPNDIARLKGARFVSAIESAEGRKLNEPLIKQMTGGDKISARFLHREWFDFYPEFKIFLATNHKPVIRGTDHAIWRRIRLIPFTVTIPEPEQDKELSRKLLAEASGILNWALEGCLAWQHGGLGVPDEVKEATEEYRSEMDVLAAFLADCCIVDPNARVLNKELYTAYESWCRENGEEPLGQRSLGRSLGERGFTPIRIGRKGERGWVGLRLRDPDEAADMSADMSGENVSSADQISKIPKTLTCADITFGVFSRNLPYIEKNPETHVSSCQQNQDFADQNANADVSDPSCQHPDPDNP
jgi:putative DNA primase/helicase